MIARREAVGEWLKQVIRKTLEWENGNVNNEEKILLLLSGTYTLQDECNLKTFLHRPL